MVAKHFDGVVDSVIPGFHSTQIGRQMMPVDWLKTKTDGRN